LMSTEAEWPIFARSFWKIALFYGLLQTMIGML